MAITSQDGISRMDRERLLDSLVKKIQSGELRTLGIYGHGGSGKTTFTKALCERLDLMKVNLLETDPYVIGSPRGLVVPKDSPGQKVTACLSSAHELASLERDIQALQAGMDIRTIDQPWSPRKTIKQRRRPTKSRDRLHLSNSPDQARTIPSVLPTDGR